MKFGAEGAYNKTYLSQVICRAQPGSRETKLKKCDDLSRVHTKVKLSLCLTKSHAIKWACILIN